MGQEVNINKYVKIKCHETCKLKLKSPLMLSRQYQCSGTSGSFCAQFVGKLIASQLLGSLDSKLTIIPPFPGLSYDNYAGFFEWSKAGMTTEFTWDTVKWNLNFSPGLLKQLGKTLGDHVIRIYYRFSPAASLAKRFLDSVSVSYMHALFICTHP